MLWVYATIWLALALFALGEAGRSRLSRGATPPAWAWWAFSGGLAIAIVHTLVSFHFVHDWVHADAVRSAAIQTEAMFGARVGWGVYVNYLFFAVWLADAWWWRRMPALGERPFAMTWMLRGFYMVIIFHAAVVFAAPARRPLGIALACWLAWSWRRQVRPRR